MSNLLNRSQKILNRSIRPFLFLPLLIHLSSGRLSANVFLGTSAYIANYLYDGIMLIRFLEKISFTHSSVWYIRDRDQCKQNERQNKTKLDGGTKKKNCCGARILYHWPLPSSSFLWFSISLFPSNLPPKGPPAANTNQLRTYMANSSRTSSRLSVTYPS